MLGKFLLMKILPLQMAMLKQQNFFPSMQSLNLGEIPVK